MVLQQLFGVGAPDPFDYPQVFECPSGMVPQGFSARSACYSIVDVQVNTATSSNLSPSWAGQAGKGELQFVFPVLLEHQPLTA